MADFFCSRQIYSPGVLRISYKSQSVITYMVRVLLPPRTWDLTCYENNFHWNCSWRETIMIFRVVFHIFRPCFRIPTPFPSTWHLLKWFCCIIVKPVGVCGLSIFWMIFQVHIFFGSKIIFNGLKLGTGSIYHLLSNRYRFSIYWHTIAWYVDIMVSTNKAGVGREEKRRKERERERSHVGGGLLRY